MRLEGTSALTSILSADRRVRRAAWECYADAYRAHRHTFAALYEGHVRRNVFFARARGYPSALEAALAPDAVPLEVVRTTLEATQRLLPAWQRYFRTRARLLGVDRAHLWDVSQIPIPRPGHPPRAYSFDEGYALVMEALAPLGEEYAAVLRRARAERWIDIPSNAGKRAGAFSGGAYGTAPFLLLNWMGGLSAVSTLAHELGHSVHSHFAWQAQPYVYAYFSDLVSETASNLNQALLAAHLLDSTADPDEVVDIIEERMGYHLRYLFIMPILARFEIECHARVERGEALSADTLCGLMSELFREGYGDAVELDDERVGITWATYPHLYANFYVYQYASGTAAAVELAKQIRAEGAPAVARYLDLLRAGASVDPIDALRTAGVDLNAPGLYDATSAQLTEFVARLEGVVAQASSPRAAPHN